MSKVIYTLTESPTTGETERLAEDWNEHKTFTVWRGDNWKECVLQWAVSMSRHAPEKSTDYYITKIWKSDSEYGAASGRLFNSRVEITHQLARDNGVEL